jgi:adenylate cyclase
VATVFRLETLAKKYDAHLLVSATIVEGAGERFVFREVDVIRSGRAVAPWVVYELLGGAEDLLPEQPWLLRFAVAIKHYRAQDFQASLTSFRALALEKPQDHLVLRYVARCEHYLASPPPAGWDGVFTGPET